MSDLRVLVWNAEWARAHTPRGAEIRRLIQDAAPDIACVTEGLEELLPDSGQVIDSEPDYGYRMHEGRRKVLLWSRKRWKKVDQVGHPEMPTGRFVEGIASTRLGPIRTIGVCIPWRDAHVRTGRKDRSPWEDHRQYLKGLGLVLRNRSDDVANLVIGDFNQRIPRFRTPKPVFRDLMTTFDKDFSICTAGELEGADGLSIDHVAHDDTLNCDNVSVIPKVSEDGLRLSDHFGVVVNVQNGGASRGT